VRSTLRVESINAHFDGANWARILRKPSVNHQGQAQIVFTAIVSTGSGTGPGEVEATPWFPIDPQPASINPTINISIVFICALLVDWGRIIRHSAIKNAS
jgi:hypothetical protein